MATNCTKNLGGCDHVDCMNDGSCNTDGKCICTEGFQGNSIVKNTFTNQMIYTS